MSSSLKDPKVWGPALWKILHTFARTYPGQPSIATQMACRNFLQSLQFLIPCTTCRDHFKVLMARKSPPTTSGKELQHWMVWLHNQVNQLTGAPANVSEEQANQMHDVDAVSGEHLLLQHVVPHLEGAQIPSVSEILDPSLENAQPKTTATTTADQSRDQSSARPHMKKSYLTGFTGNLPGGGEIPGVASVESRPKLKLRRQPLEPIRGKAKTTKGKPPAPKPNPSPSVLETPPSLLSPPPTFLIPPPPIVPMDGIEVFGIADQTRAHIDLIPSVAGTVATAAAVAGPTPKRKAAKAPPAASPNFPLVKKTQYMKPTGKAAKGSTVTATPLASPPQKNVSTPALNVTSNPSQPLVTTKSTRRSKQLGCPCNR